MGHRMRVTLYVEHDTNGVPPSLTMGDETGVPLEPLRLAQEVTDLYGESFARRIAGMDTVVAVVHDYGCPTCVALRDSHH